MRVARTPEAIPARASTRDRFNHTGQARGEWTDENHSLGQSGLISPVKATRLGEGHSSVNPDQRWTEHTGLGASNRVCTHLQSLMPVQTTLFRYGIMSVECHQVGRMLESPPRGVPPHVTGGDCRVTGGTRVTSSRATGLQQQHIEMQMTLRHCRVHHIHWIKTGKCCQSQKTLIMCQSNSLQQTCRIFT